MIEIGLGFGGNLEDPIKAIQHSIHLLEKNSKVEFTKISSYYSTPPWGVEDQPSFINACAIAKTELKPKELLALTQSTEKAVGRKKSYNWGPRLIDIDILYYGDEVIMTENLILPHQEISRRAFVLVPLAEIMPERKIGGKTVQTLLEQLPKADIDTITKI